MTFSNQQCLWLATALDHRSADGDLLSVAELQLFARYIQLGGDSGRSGASNAELVEGLSARRRGHPAHRKAFAGANGARHSLEQRGLIACTRAVRSIRNPRTSALMVTPWQVTITADSEHVRPFAWAAAAEWIGRMLDDAALPSHARQIALRLARALDATGQLAANRQQLAELLDVHRGTALKGLRLLETRGLVSLRENRDRRTAVFAIRATIPAHVRKDDAKSAAVAPLNDDTPIQATAPAPLISTAVADDGAHHDVADDQPFTGGGATEEEAELYHRLRRREHVELPSLPVPHAEDVSWDEYDRLLDRLAESEAQAPVVVAPVAREETGGQLALETAEIERKTEPPNPHKSAGVSAEATPTAAALSAREASPATPASVSSVRGIRIAIKALKGDPINAVGPSKEPDAPVKPEAASAAERETIPGASAASAQTVSGGATAPSSPTDASATVEDTLRHDSDPDPEPEAEPEPIYVTLPEPFPVGAVTQIRDLCAEYPHGDRPVRINGEPLLRYQDGEPTTVMDSPGLHKGIERIERKYAENAAQVVRV
jgi:hypothetical protein